jgi:hypothetical protein
LIVTSVFINYPKSSTDLRLYSVKKLKQSLIKNEHFFKEKQDLTNYFKLLVDLILEASNENTLYIKIQELLDSTPKAIAN